MRKPELLLHTASPGAPGTCHVDTKTRSSLLTSLSARLQLAAITHAVACSRAGGGTAWECAHHAHHSVEHPSGSPAPRQSFTFFHLLC